MDELVQKELLVNLEDLGIIPDNIEGMTLGPVLPDGRQSLVIVSDDNFDAFGPQDNQVLAFALDMDTIPTIKPLYETDPALRYDDPSDTTEGPDADDPALWINDARPVKSLVVTTMKDGGIRTYSLDGTEKQRIEKEGIRYNNVDIIEDVTLQGRTFDIAVASDRANDTLSIFRIQKNGNLVEITSTKAPDTIFGVDDGEATAYGLATYKAPDGKLYAFVTQADGASIAQVEIVAAGGRFSFDIVRILDLPVAEGDDPADYQSEGIVIDRDTGIGYVTVEDKLGLLSFDADPASDGSFTTIADIDSGYFTPDLEGVTIHYGEAGDGLIVVSSQGDSTFAAFDRQTGAYEGSFAIGPNDERGIDGVEESDGLHIFSGSLPGFENGILITQDGSDNPEQVWPDPSDGEVQNWAANFKYTDMADVLAALEGNDTMDGGDGGGDGGGSDKMLDIKVASVMDSGVGNGGSEVVATFGGYAYVTNGESDAIDIFDLATGAKKSSIDLTTIDGYDGVNSVAVSDAGIAVAIEKANAPEPVGNMLVGENGWGTHPIFTVGASLENGYTPPGIMDGIGALELDANTVRFYVNHELVSFDGYAFDVDGIELTGSRISYFDVDKSTYSIIDGGQAIQKIVDGNGNVAVDNSFGFENNPGFMRFCSGIMVDADEFGAGRGITDTIYFAGEETGGDFSNVSGGEWALDPTTGTIYALPDFGRGAWENVTQVNTGTDNKVAFILADDTAPFDADGDGEVEAAPLYMYVGEKSTAADAGFLERNGLKDGKLYVWVADDPSVNSPAEYLEGKLDGTWVEIDNTPMPDMASEDGSTGFDEYGYPTQKTLWTRAEALNAFGFSRPEDVATNPNDGYEIVLASTGRQGFDGDADLLGTLYKVDSGFDANGDPTKTSMKVIYSGDADPEQALRSPDNLDWADDGKIYVQEDRAAGGIFGEGAVNPNDASILQVTVKGDVNRVAYIDQTVAAPSDVTEENIAFTGSIDVGDWESSGILDVSTLFGKAPGTLFIADVQAHGLDDQDRFDPAGAAGQITDDNLKEGGQLSFLTAPGTDITVTDPVLPQQPQNGVVALYDFDGSLKTTYEVGNLPDMVTFSPDGSRIFVANEGENQGNGIDPAGSISVINLGSGVVTTTGFEAFDAASLPEGVRLFPGETPATDFEPEYIALSGDGKTAYVSLQEANSIAVYDVMSETFTGIFSFGTVDHSVEGNGIDAADKDGIINITTHPVQGLRMPDAITTVQIDGASYVLTANEGDARDEDVRIEDLVLDPTAFPNAAALQTDEGIGRLEVSAIDGDTDGDGDYDALFSYGSRSFSIFDQAGNLVFDSGDDFEQFIAANRPPNAFNNQGYPTDADDVVDEDRSDNKGPEPEAIETGVIDGHTFAFIGLERDSGIMIYDISDPANSEFVDYIEGRAAYQPRDHHLRARQRERDRRGSDCCLLRGLRHDGCL